MEELTITSSLVIIELSAFYRCTSVSLYSQMVTKNLSQFKCENHTMQIRTECRATTQTTTTVRLTDVYT